VVLLALCLVAGSSACGRVAENGGEIAMYLVPSANRVTMLERAGELAGLVEKQTGLRVRAQVPSTYHAVISDLGSGAADVAWLPPFSYVVANSRFGAQARLQVVRSHALSAVVVGRSGEELSIPDLGGRRVVVSAGVQGELRRRVAAWLDELAPGWIEEPAGSDREAVRMLLEEAAGPVAAVSTWVHSGPSDLVGDGRKELDGERPGTLAQTRVVARLPEVMTRRERGYRGCIVARRDSGIRRIEDFQGRSFAFTNRTSTSGYIFPRALLLSRGVEVGEELFLGGHSDVVEAVWTGAVDGGAAYYAPGGGLEQQRQGLVGDARDRILRRFRSDGERLRVLEEMRVIAVTDTIPSDVVCVRSGFDEELWRRLEAGLQQVLDLEAGRRALYDLTGGIDLAPATDATFDEFRQTLAEVGVDGAWE
jgi:ABC-type phosphate/phosphonate transport system substrate-binding protein